MATFKAYTLAAAGQTGNNTHTGVEVTEDQGAQIALEFIVTVAGATPTVTYALQGSYDGTNYDTTGISMIPANTDTIAATRTVTAVAYYHSHVSQAQSRQYRYYRLVTTANTNVTYNANLWVADGAS